jgi:hypothetical protein
MKPTNFDAFRLAGLADVAALRGWHAPCLVSEREGCDFKSAIAEIRREGTLAVEGEFADHLVAQGQLHR